MQNSGTKNFLRRYTELPYLIDYLSTGEIYLPSPKSWDDRNDSFYLEQYAKIKGLNDTYALCLTDAYETYHHWKVFSSGPSGVCIVFDREKFLKAIQQVPDLKAEPVEYKTIKEMRGREIETKILPFLKRYPFRDEEEFRLFAAPITQQRSGYRVSIPLSTISNISLSPWTPKNVVKNVRILLKSIKGCSKIKIWGSTLIENEEWKTFSAKRT